MSNIDERLRKNIEKRDKCNEKIKKLKQDKKVEDKKIRDRRLIRIGVIAESVLGRPFQEDDLDRFEDFLYKQERNGKYYSRALNVSQSVSETEKNTYQ